jgi:hypothetical protein
MPSIFNPLDKSSSSQMSVKPPQPMMIKNYKRVKNTLNKYKVRAMIKNSKFKINRVTSKRLKQYLEQSKTIEADPHFVCGICLSLVIEPKRCDLCDKLYCKSCISTWSTKQNSCPTCNKKPFKLVDLVRYEKNNLDAVIIKCF